MPPLDTEQSRWFALEVQPHEPALRAYLRSRFPLLQDFDDVIQETYTRLLREKGPEAFDKAFLTLKLPEESRSHVLAFEDNPRGVMSAKAAGLYVCCITTMYSKEQLLALDVAPDLVADSYAEFRQLLEGSKVAA